MAYSPSSKPTRVIQSQWQWKGLAWHQRLSNIAHSLFKLFIHSIIVGFSVVLLWLSYDKTYWFPESGLTIAGYRTSSNNILNWLQFAAKVYELAVVASLASITLKAFKRTLIDTSLPFGFISGPYRVGDVSFLFNSQFGRGFGYVNWRSVWRMTAKEWKIVALAVFLMGNTLLSVLIGPASAILIIPQLNWFPLPAAFSKITAPIYYNAVEDWIWPRNFTVDRWKFNQYCLAAVGSYKYDCAAAGFDEIYTWAAGWEYSGLLNNITFQDTSGTVSRRLDMHPDNSTGTWVTSPTALVTKTMGQFKSFVRSRDVGAISQTERWKFELTESSANYQPLVQAKCNVWNSSLDENSLQNLAIPFEELECFGESPGGICHRLKDELKLWTIDRESLYENETMSYTIRTTNSNYHLGESQNISTLVFAANLPYSNGDIGGQRVVGCSYMAHWIPSIPNVDPSNTEYIETNITDLGVFAKKNDSDNGKRDSAVGPVINIDKSWLSVIDVALTSGQTAAGKNYGSLFLKKIDGQYNIGKLITAMKLKFDERDVFGPGSTFEGDAEPDYKVAQVIEKLTGSIIADAIARTGASTPLFMLLSEGKTDESYAVDRLFVQEGPNAFKYRMFKNGSMTWPHGPSPLRPLNGVTWKNLADLETRIKEKLVTVDFAAKQYGYGYGQPGPPMVFAQVVIATYLGILLTYYIISFFSGARFIRPWGDVQNLVALAWASPPPPELKHQGAEVVDKDLWSQGVTVMATSSDCVSLVFSEEQPGMERLKKNEEYY
ncbi:hypothetical protein B0T10DRAFT_588867 [Thelonectria olida]|uniref:Uncharacterized protein n=1 Tax=Thelonectria olida TaxID=1576542 RepID=A0A9P9AIY3_9HYPO|nr:hypothetical protein B0T10DRAFT_588867 [Thelonectria olida]